MSERDRAAEPISPLRFLGRGLFVDVVLPWITVRLLEQQGVSTVRALAAAALFPAASILVTWRRERRLEVIGIAVLATILLWIGTALLSDDVRFGLLRAAPAFGLFGVAALASLRADAVVCFSARRRGAGRRRARHDHRAPRGARSPHRNDRPRPALMTLPHGH